VGTLSTLQTTHEAPVYQLYHIGYGCMPAVWRLFVVKYSMSVDDVNYFVLVAVAQIKSAPKVKLMKVMESELAVSFQPAQPADNLEDADKLVQMLSLVSAYFVCNFVRETRGTSLLRKT